MRQTNLEIVRAAYGAAVSGDAAAVLASDRQRCARLWPMSSNVYLVRSIYAAWECGDYSSSEWADPEIETIIADGPSPSRSTGLAGMAQVWGDFLSAWTDFRIEVEDYRELDDERVLVLDRFIARGKTSGLELGET